MTVERNKKLFYLVAEAIEEFPEMHRQESFIEEADIQQDIFVAGRKLDYCGTTQCVAGWAALLEGRVHYEEGSFSSVDEHGGYQDFDITGAELLGLTSSERGTLFYHMDKPATGDWPEALRAIGDGEDIYTVLHGFSEEEVGL